MSSRATRSTTRPSKPTPKAAAAAAARGLKAKKELPRSPSVEEIPAPPGLKKAALVPAAEVKPGGKTPSKKVAGPVAAGRGRSTKKIVKSAEMVESDSDAFEIVDYTGKDLDKYESDFIDDEAEESNDEKEVDRASGDEGGDGEEEGFVLSEDDAEAEAEVSKAEVGEVSEDEQQGEVEVVGREGKGGAVQKDNGKGKGKSQLVLSEDEVESEDEEVVVVESTAKEDSVELALSEEEEGCQDNESKVHVPGSTHSHRESPPWGPIMDTPPGPMKRRQPLPLSSPETPSPQKPIVKGKKRVTYPSDAETPDPTPVKKPRRQLMFEIEDEFKTPPPTTSKPKAARPVPKPVFKPKLVVGSGKQQVVESTSVDLDAASITKKETEKFDATVSSETNPQTPVKKTAVVPMLSPSRTLQKEFASLSFCAISSTKGEFAELMDNLLNYDGLRPMRLIPPYTGQMGSIDTVGFTSGIAEEYFVDSTLAEGLRQVRNVLCISRDANVGDFYSKLARKIQLPLWGQNIAANLARLDPAMLTTGTSADNKKFLMLKLGPKAKPQNVAFITFGLVSQDSNVHVPAQLGQWDLYTRTIHLCPITVEWERQITAAHLALAREGMYVSNYSGGVAFQTKIENKPNGAGTGRKGFNRAVSASSREPQKLDYETFGKVGLKNCSKYASLSTWQDKVACFDATHIFTGPHPKVSFDTTTLGLCCPPYEREFVKGDLVAVFHSVNAATGKVDGVKKDRIDFGLYAAVLLAHSPGM